MRSDAFGQFLFGVGILMAAAFVLSAVVTAPDPFTQAAVSGALFPLALVVSYVLAYRRGFEWL